MIRWGKLLVLVTAFAMLHGSSLVHAQKSEAKSKVLKHKMKKLDGTEVALDQYTGKVVMVVNVASQCGLTPQYTQLQELHEKYGKTKVSQLLQLLML